MVELEQNIIFVRSAATAFLNLLVHGARYKIARGQVFQGRRIPFHEPLAIAVEQNRPLAAATFSQQDAGTGDTGLTVNLHVGYQKFTGTDPRNAAVGGAARSNDSVASYKDYKVGLSYALPKDFTVGAFWSKAAGADVCGYGAYTQSGLGCASGPYPSNLAKSTGTVFVQKTF